jgi:3-dehydroquinate synthase
VVQQDPHERGLRAILNYGHTTGHAIEVVLGYGVVPHGFAVAMGMSLAAELAVRLGFLDRQTADRQDALLRRLDLPTLTFRGGTADNSCEAANTPGGFDVPSPGPTPESDVVRAPGTIPSLPPTARLLEAMALDKKARGGRLRFVLPQALGVVAVHEVAAEQVAAVLEDALPC